MTSADHKGLDEYDDSVTLAVHKLITVYETHITTLDRVMTQLYLVSRVHI